VEVLLDESMNEPSLKEWIPLLQCRAGMRAEGVQRMKNSLAEGIASIERYGNLVYRDDNLNGKDLAELCSLIAQRPGGFNVALEIVWMRIATHKQNKIPIPEEILAAGRSLLRRFEFKDTNDSQTFHLTQLIKICLAGPPGEAVAIEMCQHIRSSLQHWHFSDSETTSVLGALLPTQPVAVLDALFPLDAEHDNHIGRMRFEMDLHNRSAFDNVPEQTLLAWCEQRRTVRYSLMAALIFPFRVEQNSETRLWTQTALRLLDRAPDRVEVLRQYIDKFRPMSWSGSRISPWAANVKLLDSLVDYPDPRLIAFVADEKIRLSGVLDSVRQREASKESRENERFE
jgi:hypothetical protein